MSSIPYNTRPELVIALCEVISEHGDEYNESQDYIENSGLSKTQFYRTRELARKLGFVEPTSEHGADFQITARGRMALKSETQREKAFRQGVHSDSTYTLLLEEMRDRIPHAKGIPRDSVEELIASVLESDIGDNRVRYGTTTFLRVLEEAGYGDYESRGGKKYFLFDDSAFEGKTSEWKRFSKAIEGEYVGITVNYESGETTIKIPSTDIPEDKLIEIASEIEAEIEK